VKKAKFLSTLIAIGLFISPLIAAGPVQVQIERTAERFNLGISAFFVEGRETPDDAGSKFRQVVKDDLDFSKLFNLVLDGPVVKKGPDAVQWAKIGSDVVLTGVAQVKSGDKLSLSARLIDVNTAKEVLDVSKKGDYYNLPRLAHEISNEIVKYFTGQQGIFTRQIAFVNDFTGRKELYVADYNGKNMCRLTNDNSIVILPRISRDGSKIIFTSYRSGNPDLFLINIDGTGRRRISAKAGLNVSPSWAPSGEELAVTLSIDESPNIYLIDLNGVVKSRLTRNPGADTAPAISPDGSQLAFTSDQPGFPQIYIMNMDGTGLRRITSVGHCDSAAWSPDGQILAYVKAEGNNHFDIYSIEVLTGIERRLTWGQGDNENPAWSPDGRFIIFTSSRRGKIELFIMSADGTDQRPLVTEGQSFTPHWGS